LQGLHLQLEPQLQPWAVSPDSAAASNCCAFFSGATPSTTVALVLLLFSSRSGYFFPQEQFEPQLQLDPQLQDIFSQSVIKLKQLKMKSTKEKKKSF
jgi:hypothetical protein